MNKCPRCESQRILLGKSVGDNEAAAYANITHTFRFKDLRFWTLFDSMRLKIPMKKKCRFFHI